MVLWSHLTKLIRKIPKIFAMFLGNLTMIQKKAEEYLHAYKNIKHTTKLIQLCLTLDQQLQGTQRGKKI